VPLYEIRVHFETDDEAELERHSSVRPRANEVDPARSADETE
jgi:hypothetical protein